MSYVQSVKLLLEDLKLMEPSGAMRLSRRLKMTRQAVYAWSWIGSERYARQLLVNILETTRGVESDIHAAAKLRMSQCAEEHQGGTHV